MYTCTLACLNEHRPTYINMRIYRPILAHIYLYAYECIYACMLVHVRNSACMCNIRL